MRRFVLERAVGALGVLFALVTIVFVLQAIVPGDPVRARVGANASAETVAAERERLGLDRPIPAQYVSYVGGALAGDLGESTRTSRPVTQDLREFLPATIELAFVAMLLAVVGGLVLGIIAASASRGSSALRMLFLGGASAPSFLLAFVFVYVFYLKLGWFPASGQTDLDGVPDGPTGALVVDGLLAGRLDVTADALWHLVLPAVALALLPAVAIGRVLRSSLLEVYEADYVRTAKAKGLHPRVVLLRHALRNALSAPLTMTGLQFGLLLGGVIVIETIFAWPGIGLYTDQSIGAGDLTAIAGVTLVVAAGFVIVNTLVDLAQAKVDPRVRL